jgi:hypothetical protein
MTFIHNSVTVSLRMILKTSYITNYILQRLRDLICLINTSLAIGFMSGSTIIEFVEICFRIMSCLVIAYLM